MARIARSCALISSALGCVAGAALDASAYLAGARITHMGISHLPTALNCPSANGSMITDTTTGTTYVVECGFDRHYYDIAMIYTYTLDQCIAECAANDECLDVSWIPGNAGPCFLKNGVGRAQAREGVWSARIASSNRIGTLDCPSDNGLTYTDPGTPGRQYIVQCDTDHAGLNFEMGPVYVDSPEECIAACDKKSGCQAIVLSGSACYLKTGISKGFYAEGTFAAKCISGCQPASANSTVRSA